MAGGRKIIIRFPPDTSNQNSISEKAYGKCIFRSHFDCVCPGNWSCLCGPLMVRAHTINKDSKMAAFVHFLNAFYSYLVFGNLL